MASGSSSRFDNFRRQCMGSERPKLKDLYKHVTPCYAAQWEDIGVYLDIELGHLQIIKADHPGDTSGCCKDLWKKWLELDPNATWEKLFAAIDDCAAASNSAPTGIHSTTTAITVKCSPLDVSRLKARYIKLLPTGKTDWPKHKVTYVRLAIVEKESITLRDKHLNELTRLTLQGDVDKILKKKQPLGGLRDIFHYNDETCPRLILIMGGPGIGKTTLANELCVRWARDGFLAEDFGAVVLIPLRLVQQRSLEEVVVEHIGEDNYQQMMKSAGSKCLIILEGFDELAIHRRQSDPFLLRLIKECTILEEATILITSRPHACEEIDAGRRVEVVGFGNDEVREFVEKCFPQDLQSVQEFLQQLDKYPQLHSLFYIPMNLVMMVDIFQCSEKKLLSTLTELYKVFILMTLKRQVKKENVTKKPAVCSSVAVRAADSVEETLCVMLRGIPKETVGIVLCLSRLAYRGFFDWYYYEKEKYSYGQSKEPKIIFTESDLTQCDIEVTSDFDGFGLLKATQTHQLLTDVNTYSFSHLTIQEYFCAVYISLQSQQEQLRLLREHFRERLNIFIFVCGLTGLISSEMFQFVYSMLTSPGSLHSGDPDVVIAMRFINESKQSSQSISPFTLNMAGCELFPSDHLCVSNMLSCYPVSQLMMGGCSIGNKGAELLVKHCSNENTSNQLLEELYLGHNDLTSEGIEHVMKIVRTSSATFRVLEVRGNDIGDDGMAVISEALQHNKSLTKLEVQECGLSGKGAVYISQLLNVTDTLQELNVNFNDIGDDGMAVISEALQHSKSLTTLEVERCGLSVKGAISISKMMMVNHLLQTLYIFDNNIGDDGVSAIVGALGNCKINRLNVQKCGITLTGARLLATALASNRTIRELYLSHNPITVEGALLIVKSAVDNTVCQHVIVNLYKNKEVYKMMKILEDRRKQQKSHIMYTIVDNSSSSEEVVHTLPIIAGDGPTVNMGVPSMNQSEDDDHSGGREEGRGCHSDQVPSKKDHRLMS